MNTQFLFPSRFKKIGWILFIPAITVGLALFIIDNDLLTNDSNDYFNATVFALMNSEMDKEFFLLMKNNVLDEILGIMIIIGGILVAFSKEKQEDEFISRIRLESLAWASYVNYAILLLAILFVYGFSFFWALVFNMFTTLLFFIIRFNWALRKSSKLISNEE